MSFVLAGAGRRCDADWLMDLRRLPDDDAPPISLPRPAGKKKTIDRTLVSFPNVSRKKRILWRRVFLSRQARDKHGENYIVFPNNGVVSAVCSSSVCSCSMPRLPHSTSWYVLALYDAWLSRACLGKRLAVVFHHSTPVAVSDRTFNSEIVSEMI